MLMNVFRRSLLGVSAVLFVAPAMAAYPDKSIRFIVPQAAGGSTDILSRTIGQKLSEALGQPVVMDNRPGANGIVGVDMVAKSQADGYTLVAGGTGTIAINVSLYSKIPYDPIRDFAPVVNFAYSTSVQIGRAHV